MDYTAAKNYGFVSRLSVLADTYPIGVASCFNALHSALVEVVSRFGGDLGVELVEKVARLRTKVGLSVGEDYQSKLQDYRLMQNPEYFTQRGFVAAQLLSELKPEPFKVENDLTLEQLDWIIPSLTEARPAFDIELHETREMFAPEIKQAYALKLALDGIPEEKSELKFLVIQELTLARLKGYVPSSAMYGYWQSLTPKNEAAKVYHVAVEDALFQLPCQEMTETAYIEGGLILLESLAETVAAACRDWETRILSQQTTEYLAESCRLARMRITELQRLDKTGELKLWASRCEEMLDRIKGLPKMVERAEICKHFELSPEELSAYADNFTAYSEETYLALANC